MATDFSERCSERTAMERFGLSGMALLPWTKQMLTVLWEQLRLLVQVIYYTFMSVFQMFRFEVHVRITDETGEHIQHMGTAANPSESFLFSSVVAGSNPLSNFCADVSDPFAANSTTEALLSSLRGDDLCCGLVDDLVSRAAGQEESIFVGTQSTWKMGFPGDWNIFVSSSSDTSCSDGYRHQNTDQCSKADGMKDKSFKQENPEEERSSLWSGEEKQLAEFDSEETKALWESLSSSNDPYNPFFFTACISTKTDMGKGKESTNGDVDHAWLCRSDSESSWSSWAESECSSSDMDKEESDKLWELFSSPEDPYNPLNFSACTVSCKSPQSPDTKHTSALPAPPHNEDKESCSSLSEDDGEELLWKSLCRTNDPYHPLNFQASIQTSTPAKHRSKGSPVIKREVNVESDGIQITKVQPDSDNIPTEASQTSTAAKPALPERRLKPHIHPETRVVPWKRPAQLGPTNRKGRDSPTHKQVRFSPQVQVHVMRTWPFARHASRKGHWEEMARDRERFRRRIEETERAIGFCLSPSHRQKVRLHLDKSTGGRTDGALKKS